MFIWLLTFCQRLDILFNRLLAYLTGDILNDTAVTDTFVIVLTQVTLTIKHHYK